MEDSNEFTKPTVYRPPWRAKHFDPETGCWREREEPRKPTFTLYDPRDKKEE